MRDQVAATKRSDGSCGEQDVTLEKTIELSRTRTSSEERLWVQVVSIITTTGQLVGVILHAYVCNRFPKLSFGMRKGCAPMGGARACGSLTFIHNPSNRFMNIYEYIRTDAERSFADD